MAAAATKSRAAKKTTAKAKPAPEVDEEELEDTDEVDETDDVEELEDDEATDAPASKAKADEVTFGVRDLCDLLKKKTGDDVTPRNLRNLIRKMARDESKRVNREIVAGNRTRYDWTGPKDPEVIAIVKAYTDGELEADKQEKLAALKAQKQKKDAEKKAAAEELVEAASKSKKTTKAKAKPAPVEEVDDDEELTLDDEDDD